MLPDARFFSRHFLSCHDCGSMHIHKSFQMWDFTMHFLWLFPFTNTLWRSINCVDCKAAQAPLWPSLLFNFFRHTLYCSVYVHACTGVGFFPPESCYFFFQKAACALFFLLLLFKHCVKLSINNFLFLKLCLIFFFKGLGKTCLK